MCLEKGCEKASYCPSATKPCFTDPKPLAQKDKLDALRNVLQAHHWNNALIENLLQENLLAIVEDYAKQVPADMWRAIPSRRWMDCGYGYKMMLLGLAFSKEIGTYHLLRCPVCNVNLIDHLTRNLEANKKK